MEKDSRPPILRRDTARQDSPRETGLEFAGLRGTNVMQPNLTAPAAPTEQTAV